MAQLPPKLPLTWRQCEETVPVNQNPHWVDEFFNFSSCRQCCHRRSMSDSITFMEVDEQRKYSFVHGHGDEDSTNADGHALWRTNDELFLDMIADCMVPNLPSDHNSNNDEETPGVLGAVLLHQPKIEHEEEVLPSCKSEGLIASDVATSSEKIVDPKRIKRILANRQSAQRSRVRKLQYISELERRVSSLQAEVSVLSPQVAFLDHQRLILNADNSALKERITALTHDKIFKDAHEEALKAEIERLRRLYYQLKLKMSTETAPASPPTAAIDTNCSAMDGKLESTEHIDNLNVI